MNSKSKLVQFKRPNLEVSVNDVDTSSRRVKGYLASFGNVDSHRDIIQKGAFTKSLNERGVYSSSNRKIAHLYQHDMSRLIGVFEELREDEKGLYFVSRMLNTTEGNDRLIEYQEGALREHSIGFKYVTDKMDYDEKDDIWNLKELNLFEGSAVTFGSNSETPYLGSFKNTDTLEEKLKVLELDFIANTKITKSKASDEAIQAAYYKLEIIYKTINDLVLTPKIKAVKDTLKQEPKEEVKTKSFIKSINQYVENGK